MKFTIHDVGHGMCISLTHGDKAVLWDCGYKEGNCPSEFLSEMGIDSIETLFVTNYDEDHINDLPDLRLKFDIGALIRNQTISKDALRKLKEEGGDITNAMEHLLYMIGSYTYPLTPNIMGVGFPRYFNQYLTDFRDTNNISLVTFPIIGDKKFIIPGDLEKAGWEKLLEKPEFRAELRDVDVFIASHHGREGGYCEKVFEYCNPEVVVICDSAIKHETQEGMAAKYAKHATGINFQGKERSVLSTRKDGSFCLEYDRYGQLTWVSAI